jgi:hypothetical protein
LHNRELHILYSSRDVIRQIKSRRMRWAGHVAHMGWGETCIGFWWESPKETDHLKDQGVDGRMGLEWTLGRFACLRIGTVGGFRECGDEPSGFGAAELVTCYNIANPAFCL